MINLDRSTRFPGFVEQLKAVAGARYDAARDWLLNPGKNVESYTQDEWLLAQKQVAREWFGDGVKTDEAVASLVSGIGSVMEMLGIPTAGRYLGESRVGLALAATVVAGGLGLMAYDQAFGSGVDHVLAQGSSNIHKGEAMPDTQMVLVQTIPEHHLVVDQPGKEQSFFIVDQETVVKTFDATGIVPNYGLPEVDRVVGTRYTDANTTPEQRILIDKIVGQINMQSATGEILALTPDMAVLQLQDTHLASVVSLVDGMRRGGMKIVVDGTADIVVGISTTGQLFAVFGATPEGDLTGLTTGEDSLAISPLIWGEGDQEKSLGIMIDGEFHSIFDQNGKINLHSESGVAKNASTFPTFLTNYESPDLSSLRGRIDEESGGKYAIEDGGGVWSSETQTLMPGVNVDKNGKMWVELSSGERVKLEAGDVTFDEDTGEMIIKGYKMEDGKWMEAQLTPEQQLNKDVEEWNLNLDNYTQGYDAEGNIELRDKSGKLVYWNGRWSGDITLDMIKESNSCEATDFVPAYPGANWTGDAQREAFAKYSQQLAYDYIKSDLIEAEKDEFNKLRDRMMYLGKKYNNCWVMDTETHFNDGRVLGNLVWRDSEGNLRVIRSFNPKDHQ